MSENNAINELSGNLKQYIKTTIEIIKLEILQRTIVISSYILIRLMSWMILVIALVFFSISLAFLLSAYLQSFVIGFALIGGVYIVLAFLISSLNRRKIEKRLQNKIIRHLFSDQQIVPIVTSKTNDYE
jgi:hypothetical protein